MANSFNSQDEAPEEENVDDVTYTKNSVDYTTVDLSGYEITNVANITSATITNTSINMSNIYANPGTWTINSYDGSGWSWEVEDVPFENSMPNIEQVKEMCEEYPGLNKAYENFKTAYTLVEQDWKGKNK